MKTTIKRNWLIGMMIILMIFSAFTGMAQESTLPKSVIDKMEKVVDANAEYVQDIYKDIHEFAELPFMEFRTAGVVERELKSLGFEVYTEIGITGVVGILRNGDGPVLMYRGDMDALSIKEETGLPYASKQVVTNREGEEVPVSHMCGHDANTTFLIGLAHTMAEMKNDWSGTLVLVAQPAEELVQGAQAMIDNGLYTKHNVPKPDYFLAQHTGPLPVGSMTASAGRIMTGTTHMDVTFHGIGGHGSSPHHAKDPVVMAGMAIVQLQTVVSRYTDPNEVAVLTIGSVQAGKDYNVIPTEAHLKLKLHFSNEETMNKMIKGIHDIVNSIALANDVSEEMMPTITQSGFGPAVYNDKDFISRIRSVTEKVDFVNNRIDDFVSSGSEDAFALINGLDDVKGAYLFLGGVTAEEFAQAQKEGKEFPFFVHEPYYHVSMEGITFGTKTAALIALDILQK
ncbi:amidohydrolase [Draconibacterium sp. IB214405]|uniref:amidohydrolase n=1 Tax=Draconibacterium sp. IB214405 TaxID=3097352 RepID=UPI002A117547|nr:amidohydrolase [Draconibacterium sp. IB214405]MDX8339059.1 amidohydrolase [Draconibacterium sp. IB214405]